MPTLSDFRYSFRHLWWFVTGLCANVKQWMFDGLGHVRVYDRPFWFVFNPTGYKVKARQLRKALSLLEPGDVVVRAYDSYLLSLFIPGRFSHSGVYVGKHPETGAGLVVHALGTGVQMTDVLDFFMCCDAFAILRPRAADAVKEQACAIAKRYIGATYDYRFDICDDYKNEDEVTARTKSVYCHELTRSCYPTLDVPVLQPQLWNGMIRSEKKQFLAQ